MNGRREGERGRGRKGERERGRNRGRNRGRDGGRAGMEGTRKARRENETGDVGRIMIGN